MEQLAAISLSDNTRTSQQYSNSTKQGSFDSWSHVCSQDNSSVSRDFSKHSIQMPSNSSDVPSNFIHTNPMVHSFMKKCYPISYFGTQNSSKTSEGDICKKVHESNTSDSSSSDDTLSTLKRKMKRKNDNVESTHPVEEKTTSENEERNKLLQEYLKSFNTNLNPDPIEHKEGVFSSVGDDTFSYPDFLPPPYNTLDLQKLSKLDNWRTAFKEPLDYSIDLLISRLIRMERLQHLTVVREKRKEAVYPTVAVNNLSSSSTDIHQRKQLRPFDFSCSQAAFDCDRHNFDSSIHERHIQKCTSQHRPNKQSSGGASPVRSSTKSSQTSCSTSKCVKVPVTVDSSNVIMRQSTSCSGSSSKIHTGVKMTSSKLLSSSTTDNDSSKSKDARSKRKPCKKQ
nr:PREDICTED: protein FAM217A isoform X2 [Anolis carolinensis]|eukprot:XP_016850645.1 PREDICTED: protein FAM217A isoform X2 [Anolis carolinensis]